MYSILDLLYTSLSPLVMVSALVCHMHWTSKQCVVLSADCRQSFRIELQRAIHTLDIARWQQLRSAGSCPLFIPRHRRSMFGRLAFSVAGPVAWNSLPDYLRDLTCSFDSFRSDLKTFLFLLY